MPSVFPLKLGVLLRPVVTVLLWPLPRPPLPRPLPPLPCPLPPRPDDESGVLVGAVGGLVGDSLSLML